MIPPVNVLPYHVPPVFRIPGILNRGIRIIHPGHFRCCQAVHEKSRKFGPLGISRKILWEKMR